MTDRDPDAAKRRAFLKGVMAAGALVSVAPDAWAASPLAITHGTVTGDVTDTSALVWARTNDVAEMHVELWRQRGGVVKPGSPRRSASIRVDDATDFTGKLELDALDPDTSYAFEVEAEGDKGQARSQLATFRTAPTPRESRSVNFTWGADVGQGMENRPPFPAFAAMQAEQPAFFIFNGDTIYGDSRTPVGGTARSLPEFYAKYKENREDPLFQSLARSTPLIVNWDDHEVNSAYRGLDPAVPAGRLANGRKAFLDYWPIRNASPATWRALRWGRELEVFVLDCRQFAAPLAMADGPAKSMLGKLQFDWLEQRVAACDATWKVLVTSCPLSILRTAEPPYDDWVAYEHELGRLLETWRRARVRNIVWLTADVHWAQAIEYPAYDMWEFVGAPIGADPRTERRPLSPTFQPVERFLSLAVRHYGSVAIDAHARTMTVDLKGQDGSLRHRTVLQARGS